jgi:predicted Abi (CAAX) family protease
MQTAIAGRQLFLIRLGIGLTQGLALYLLYHAVDSKIWPATDGLIFAPLLLAWVFAPVLLTLGLGEMPRHRAAVWAVAAALIIAALGFYDIWSAWPLDWD